MRFPAAVPAVALLAGTALGLRVPDVPQLIPLATMVAACATAVVGRRHDHVLIASVVAGFCAGGEALSSDAWSRARASPLRQVFEAAAAIERVHAAAEHRFMPLDPSVYALVDGVLRSDASPSPSGLSLNLDITRIAPFATAGVVHDVVGGALITVTGSLAASLGDEWRAGRRVRLPTELHRPSRYLDAGVPDGERRLLLR